MSRLNAKILAHVKSSGVCVSNDVHSDLTILMDEMSDNIKSQSSDSVQRLFWEQQLQSAKLKDHRQMRWHPMMIRWCLFLKSKSTVGYEALRNVIKLPSSRTLRDYTHVYHGKVGFQVEVDQQLITELNINDLPEWEKHIEIVFDEMKIKDGIIFDKYNFEILGYVNLGEVTNQLLEFEALCSEVSSETHLPEVAKYINCFMVRSIFQPFNFPYAQFNNIRSTFSSCMGSC